MPHNPKINNRLVNPSDTSLRIWFNKTFSSIASVMELLHQDECLGQFEIICSHIHDNASAFLAADESYLEPEDLQGEPYLQWCLKFCQQQCIDIFWPGKEAAIIEQHQDLFALSGTKILVAAQYETLNLLNNKARFYQDLPPEIAKTMDFVIVNQSDEFDAGVAQLSQQHEQLCVKPAQSVYGLGFRILDKDHDSVQHILQGMEYRMALAELHGLMNQRSRTFDNALLVMEFLSGDEWSVDCAARHGTLLSAIQRRKTRQGYGQTIDNNANIHTMVQRLTKHYCLNALFNIQFREGKYGIRLLEINARPSGGVAMSCLAGVNLASLALRSLDNEPVSTPTPHYGLKVTQVYTAKKLSCTQS